MEKQFDEFGPIQETPPKERPCVPCCGRSRPALQEDSRIPPLPMKLKRSGQRGTKASGRLFLVEACLKIFLIYRQIFRRIEALKLDSHAQCLDA
jgi:hypothetical protein